MKTAAVRNGMVSTTVLIVLNLDRGAGVIIVELDDLRGELRSLALAVSASFQGCNPQPDFIIVRPAPQANSSPRLKGAS